MEKFNKLLGDVEQIKGICEEQGIIKKEVELVKSDVTQVKDELAQFKAEMRAELTQVKADTLKNTASIGKLQKDSQEEKTYRYSKDQYSKKYNVIIRGIPYSQNENVRNIVRVIADKLKINLQAFHLAAAHRLPADEGAIPPIIVRFNDLDIKSEMVTKAKKEKLNGSDFGSLECPIYVDEHLNAHTMRLLNEAKRQRDLGIFAFAWCRDGKVYIRDVQGEPRRRIIAMEDLTRTSSRKRTVEERSPNGSDSVNRATNGVTSQPTGDRQFNKRTANQPLAAAWGNRSQNLNAGVLANKPQGEQQTADWPQNAPAAPK